MLVGVASACRQPDAAVSPVWTAEDLADADFDWTIIDGKVHALLAALSIPGKCLNAGCKV